MSFLKKWWGKLKTSPLYVKVGVVTVIFLGIYMLFIKKSNSYDNVTTAEIQNPITNDTTSTTYVPQPPTTTTSDVMTTNQNSALYEAQLALLNQQNSQLSSQLASKGVTQTTPSLSDYLNPIIAKTAGNFLTDLLNPNSKAQQNTPTIVTTNTSSPVNVTSVSSDIYGTKNYSGFGSDAYGIANGLIDNSVVSSTNLFTSDTYTGFGSDSYAKSNFGW